MREPGCDALVVSVESVLYALPSNLPHTHERGDGCARERIEGLGRSGPVPVVGGANRAPLAGTLVPPNETSDATVRGRSPPEVLTGEST